MRDEMALLSARDLPAVMATPQAGEASQEMMSKMNASMAAILRLAEMNR